MSDTGDNIAISRENHEQTANDLACAVAANKRYAEELASLRAALEAREGELEKEKSDRHEEYRIQNDAIAELHKERDQLRAENIELTRLLADSMPYKTVAQLRAENAELRERNETLKNEDADLRREIGEFHYDVGEIKIHLADCGYDIDDLPKFMDELLELRERVEADAWLEFDNDNPPEGYCLIYTDDGCLAVARYWNDDYNSNDFWQDANRLGYYYQNVTHYKQIGEQPGPRPNNEESDD